MLNRALVDRILEELGQELEQRMTSGNDEYYGPLQTLVQDITTAIRPVSVEEMRLALGDDKARMKTVFENAERPTCRNCGSTAMAFEMHYGYWDSETRTFEASEICDRGHQCDNCGDMDARIDWRIVI